MIVFVLHVRVRNDEYQAIQTYGSYEFQRRHDQLLLLTLASSEVVVESLGVDSHQ